MTIWKWKALDDQGTVHQGICEESKKDYVVARLRNQKLYPFRIRQVVWGSLWQKATSWRFKFYWASTSRQIGTLLEAGIPLLTVLEIIMDKEKHPLIHNQWERAYHMVGSGKDFSTSIRDFQPDPGPFLLAMIKAGENTGTLSACILDGADQLEEEYYFLNKIKTAVLYPILLLFVAIVVIYTLSIVVLPMYENLFKGLGTELPTLTTMLFVVGSYIPYVLLVICCAFIAVVMSGRFRRFRVKMPGTIEIERYRELMQFCKSFERLLIAGYPLVGTLQILETITKEPKLRKLIQDLHFSVQVGKRISPVFLIHPFFPADGAKMIAVAEESGRLDQMLGHLAILFKRELQERIERYTRLLEPVLVVGISGLVGIVAVGVLMPIFEMGIHIQ